MFPEEIFHAKITIEINGNILKVLEADSRLDDNIQIEAIHQPEFVPVGEHGLYALKSETFSFKITYKQPVAL